MEDGVPAQNSNAIAQSQGNQIGAYPSNARKWFGVAFGIVALLILCGAGWLLLSSRDVIILEEQNIHPEITDTYLYHEEDFQEVGFNLSEYPVDQYAAEPIGEDQLNLKGYYTSLGDLDDWALHILVSIGDDKGEPSDLKSQGKVIAGNEYGESSVRIQASEYARVISVEKGNRNVIISYDQEYESKVNDLLEIGLARLE